jgi:quercetin 2,3-dioxygenase
MALMHVALAPGAELRLPWNAQYNCFIYALAGSGGVGRDERPVQTGQLAAFGSGDTLRLRAADRQDSRAANLEALILGGAPIREPVEHYGPFVMNTREEILEALEDFEAGRLGQVPPNALMPPSSDPNPVRAEHAGI